MQTLINVFLIVVVIIGVYAFAMIGIGYVIQRCRRLIAASARLLKRHHTA